MNRILLLASVFLISLGVARSFSQRGGGDDIVARIKAEGLQRQLQIEPVMTWYSFRSIATAKRESRQSLPTAHKGRVWRIAYAGK